MARVLADRRTRVPDHQLVQVLHEIESVEIEPHLLDFTVQEDQAIKIANRATVVFALRLRPPDNPSQPRRSWAIWREIRGRDSILSHWGFGSRMRTAQS